MVQYEYLKLFIFNCKSDYKFNCRRYLMFCNKTMAPFFYILACQVELDDRIFFTAVELLNRYLVCSITKASSTIDLKNQYETIKQKYLRDKYIIATGCFQLASQICGRVIDTPRLIESFHELTRRHSNMESTTNRLNRDQLIEIEIHILKTIDHIFPRYTPHMFISYFLRFLSDDVKMSCEHLHNASMLLLVHIYLQWTSLIEILAKKESGSSAVNKIQIESVAQRFRDPLLLGSATILTASKMFCHNLNSQSHDKIISSFVHLLGIDPMRIYMAQFFADEVIRKSLNIRVPTGPINSMTSRMQINRDYDLY